MDNETLKEIKKLAKKNLELADVYGKNIDILEEMKKDEKVLKYAELLYENKTIKNEIDRNKEMYIRKIENNCDHRICKHTGRSDLDQEGRRYYSCVCIGCGYRFEDWQPLYGIRTDKLYPELHREYINLLLKYDIDTAVEIMMYKYNKNNIFNELVENGIEVTKCLN